MCAKVVGMTTVEALTDQLLQTKTGASLPFFISHQVQMGNDVNGIVAALMIATGQVFDKRTVQKWIDCYGAGE